MNAVVRAPSRAIKGEDKVNEIKAPIAAPIRVNPSSDLLTPSATCKSGILDSSAPSDTAKRKKQT